MQAASLGRAKPPELRSKVKRRALKHVTKKGERKHSQQKRVLAHALRGGGQLLYSDREGRESRKSLGEGEEGKRHPWRSLAGTAEGLARWMGTQQG